MGASGGLPVPVIEDDSHRLRSLRDILRRRGSHPLTAQSAREGLALVERALPAVALVDLKLPDMDGVEVMGTVAVVAAALLALVRPALRAIRVDSVIALSQE